MEKDEVLAVSDAAPLPPGALQSDYREVSHAVSQTHLDLISISRPISTEVASFRKQLKDSKTLKTAADYSLRLFSMWQPTPGGQANL